MAKEGLYGFPCVENPHDFEPDLECCTEAEIAFHAEAKKRWDAGERDVRGKRCGWGKEGDAVLHITQTSWGIGVNYVEMEEASDEQL
jgi:hypothetical protein